MDGPIPPPNQSPAVVQTGSCDPSVSSYASPPPTMSSVSMPYGMSGTQQQSDRMSSPGAQNHMLPQTNGLPSPYQYAAVPGPASAPTGMMPDHYLSNESVMSTPRTSPTHPSVAALSAQKRPYRQRRKEPSCDACRERKVKCDATDTSSCSECSSRAVKCQFTKETNRRMSSIKQVQDLEKQLSNANHQIDRLRSIIQNGGPVGENDSAGLSVPALQIPESSTKDSRPGPPALENFDETRRNIRNYSRGIFKPPPAYRQSGHQPSYPHDHALPPKPVADRLLSHYHGSVHVYAPMLHWPTFTQEVENVYRANTFRQMPHTWVALFYAVLACGTLMDPQPHASVQDGEGAWYLDMCMQSINNWSDEFTLNSVRSSLLISMYFIETNFNSAGWVWLGTAVRIAQEIGIHVDSGRYAPMEARMRRRVWWSVYKWDRAVSLEVGRPLVIDDDDCDVSEPTPVDNDAIRPSGAIMPPPGPQTAPNGILAVVPVVRITAQMKKTLKSRTITAATLATYDEHFKSIMASYPDPFPIHSQSYLDPRLLTAACALQTTRLFLYRHNLSLACRRSDRKDALDRCVSVAMDTAHYVSRSMQPTTPSATSPSGHFTATHMASWAARLRTMAPAFFCKHIWRCTLILCLSLEYRAALTLVQASAAVGDLRKNNIACGRNLVFFLDQLIMRLRAGVTKQGLEQDEEILAYASGDMQQSAEESWAWTGSETGSTLNNGAQPQQNGYASERSTPMTEAGAGGSHTSSTLGERDMREWGDWEHIQRTLESLLQNQQAQQHDQQQQYREVRSGQPPPKLAPGAPMRENQQPGPHYPPPPVRKHRQNSNGTLQGLAPPVASPAGSVSPAPSNNGGSSRISIRDIM